MTEGRSVWPWDQQQSRGGMKSGYEELFGVLELFYILIEVMVSQR